VLIRHQFDSGVHQFVNFFLQRSIKRMSLRTKISLANFCIRTSLSGRAEFAPLARRTRMAWKAPKIVEVPVGMEINMYACAARK
jgi:coenzyme PQQ precursor peptide PqqA